MRACEETQGTFALTISGRGFEARVSPGQDQAFMESECVSCGACVEACPTATLQEKSVIMLGCRAQQDHHLRLLRCRLLVQSRDERQSSGAYGAVERRQSQRRSRLHQGRFAWGYATHKDRVTKPMIRKSIDDAWQEVSWDEAINYAASEFRRIQAKYGKDSIGGITSSRCTNEETYLITKIGTCCLW